MATMSNDDDRERELKERVPPEHDPLIPAAQGDPRTIGGEQRFYLAQPGYGIGCLVLIVLFILLVLYRIFIGPLGGFLGAFFSF